MSIELRPGAEPLPGYRLVERLGKGNAGEVWKAESPGGFENALKFVRLAEVLGEAEQQALAVIRAVRHPQLLTTFGSWVVRDDGREDEGWLIVAMELAERTLLDRFREARKQGHPGIPYPELIRYLADAARGLDYLNHDRTQPDGRTQPGIIHRDIKPQNLLLVGGCVKVGDFGLVRVLTRSFMNHSGGMTPQYAAPEFIKGSTTRQSDQYSLAVSYCHVRGGRLPFEGDNLWELTHRIVVDPPDLTMIPDPEREAVERALAKDPKARWPTCTDFVKALYRTLRSLPRPGVVNSTPRYPAPQVPGPSPPSNPAPAPTGTRPLPPAAPEPPSDSSSAPPPESDPEPPARRVRSGVGSVAPSPASIGQTAIPATPQSPEVARVELFPELHVEVDRLCKAKRPHEARGRVQEYLAIDPDYPPALADGLRACTAEAEPHIASVPAGFAAAQKALEMGRPWASHPALLQAVGADPLLATVRRDYHRTWATLYLSRADQAAKEDRLELAVRAYNASRVHARRAVECWLAGSSARELLRFVCLHGAFLCLTRCEGAGVEPFLDDLRWLSPGDPVLHAARAYLHLHGRDYEALRESLNLARRQNDEARDEHARQLINYLEQAEPIYRFNDIWERASQALNAGNFAEALRHLADAESLRETAVEVHFMKAICFGNLSRIREARQAYKRAEELMTPDTPYAIESLHNRRQAL